jgi:hypothetical protein
LVSTTQTGGNPIITNSNPLYHITSSPANWLGVNVGDGVHTIFKREFYVCVAGNYNINFNAASDNTCRIYIDNQNAGDLILAITASNSNSFTQLYNCNTTKYLTAGLHSLITDVYNESGYCGFILKGNITGNCLSEIICSCPSTCSINAAITKPNGTNITLSNISTTLECNKGYDFNPATLTCNPVSSSMIIKQVKVVDAAGNTPAWALTFTGTGNLNIPAGTTGSFFVKYVWGTAAARCDSVSYPITITCPPLCTCGTWELFTVNDKNYTCGESIDWKCNVPLNFSARYNCNPSDPNCKTTLKWDIKNEEGVIIKYGDGGVQKFIYGSFTPVANGVYTSTVYPFCNGKECPPCTFTIVVKDCNPPVDCCKGGSWGEKLRVNADGSSTNLDECGSNLGTAPCGYSGKLKVTYNCNLQCNTQAQIVYQYYNAITNTPVGSSVTVNSGNTATITNPAVSGSYYLSIAAFCKGKKCDECKLYFNLTCTPPAECCKNTTQKDPSVYDAAGTNLATFSCKQPKMYFINAANKNCDKELIIKASANCGSDANCPSKIVYTLKNNTTGTAITGTGVLTIPASLANGAYTLTVDYYCGNTICKTCKFEIKKDCPPPPCSCPKGWLSNTSNIDGGVTTDGRCKKLVCSPIGVVPPPDGTQLGNWGFTWGYELWAYGTKENGGAPVCDFLPYQ